MSAGAAVSSGGSGAREGPLPGLGHACREDSGPRGLLAGACPQPVCLSQGQHVTRQRASLRESVEGET